MRIGLVSFEYPPETGFGGIGTYTWYHARALARLGHEVHVIAGSTKAMALTTVEERDLTVHRYHASGMLMRAISILGRRGCWWTKLRLENAWNMYRALQVLERRHRFDVLEMPECGADGSLISVLSRTPAVVRLHSPSALIMPFYDVLRADHAMCSWIEHVAMSRSTQVTSCSAFLADEVRDKLGVRTPIRVIPNGIDLSLFDEAPRVDVATKYGFQEDRVTIFFGARMERRKGIHLCGEIVETILRRHDVSFIFAGEDLFGYMAKTLLPLIEKQELRGSIRYIGKLGLPELRSCVGTADIVMLPSLWENCPYSCLEAMAASRAVISSDQGGMPELIRHGVNGLLAKSGQPASFVTQLETLIVDEQLRRKLGEEARRTVELEYTDDRIARLSTEVYEQCVNGCAGTKN